VVDAEILRRRIEALLGYLKRIERFASIDRQQFIDDADTHHLAERYLHLAIESALDIAHHLIADAGLESPETYRDAFAILARHGVIDAALGVRLQAWAAAHPWQSARVPRFGSPFRPLGTSGIQCGTIA
jgi:uncharacterized protein YutE (UPF0331/DUF86 family)